MNKEYNSIFNEIECLYVDKFDKHLKGDNISINVDYGDILIQINTLDAQDFYEFSLINLIENDKNHSIDEWIKELKEMIENLEENKNDAKRNT